MQKNKETQEDFELDFEVLSLLIENTKKLEQSILKNSLFEVSSSDELAIGVKKLLLYLFSNLSSALYCVSENKNTDYFEHISERIYYALLGEKGREKLKASSIQNLEESIKSCIVTKAKKTYEIDDDLIEINDDLVDEISKRSEKIESLYMNKHFPKTSSLEELIERFNKFASDCIVSDTIAHYCIEKNKDLTFYNKLRKYVLGEK